MPVNAAHRCAFHFHFVELFFNPVAVTGGKFQSGEQNGRESEIGFVLNRHRILSRNVEFFPRPGRVTKRHHFQQEGNVAETALGSAIDRKAFRPFEFAIDQGNVELKRETVIDRIASDELRDRAILVLTGRI